MSRSALTDLRNAESSRSAAVLNLQSPRFLNYAAKVSQLAMTAAIRKCFAENPKEFDPRKYLGPARAKVNGGKDMTTRRAHWRFS